MNNKRVNGLLALLLLFASYEIREINLKSNVVSIINFLLRNRRGKKSHLLDIVFWPWKNKCFSPSSSREMSLQMSPFSPSTNIFPWDSAMPTILVLLCFTFLFYRFRDWRNCKKIQNLIISHPKKTSSWWTRVELAKKKMFPHPTIVRLTWFTMAKRVFSFLRFLFWRKRKISLLQFQPAAAAAFLFSFSGAL